MNKHIHPDWLLHGYFLLTIIGFLQLFFCADTTVINLFGFHTAAYGFFLFLLFGDLGFHILASLMFILWLVLICLFVIFYGCAVWKKKYRLFTILVMIDMVLSFLIFLRYLQVASYGMAVLSFAGIIITLLMGLYTIRFRKYSAR